MPPPTTPSDGQLEGPEFEVWNHLESGWQQAYDDMARRVGRDSMRFFEALAEAIVGLRTTLVLDVNDLPVPKTIADTFRGVSPEQLQRLARRFFEDPSLADSSPWMRHAVDLEVGGIGMRRAVAALERFKSLKPVLAAQPIPDNARAYMREVVHTYLMGFDAACIALCRACFDQLAKAVLLRADVLTEQDLRKGHLTTLRLVELLQRNRLIEEAYEPARRLGERGNAVMHRGLYEERVLPTLSLDSITDLLAVSVALASKW